jgi:hypothetical protein
VPKTRKTILIIISVIISLVALFYGVNTWFLTKYGASTQPVPDEILNVDKNFNFPNGFPPDPGDEGKKTMHGIDADHDGIRDDVQRWIYAFVPNEPNKQMALRQMARFYQHALSDDYSLEVRQKAHILLERAIQCCQSNFTDQSNGYMETRYLKAKTLNTYKRTERYWSNDAKITSKEIPKNNHEYDLPCDNR